jgi:hypothetical protein
MRGKGATHPRKRATGDRHRRQVLNERESKAPKFRFSETIEFAVDRSVKGEG